MEILGKLCKTFGGITHNDLRGLELFSRFQRIRKLLFTESHENSCLIILVLPRLTLKSSTVDECHCIAAACILRCIMLCYDDRRVVLMTGSPSEAPDLGHPMTDRHPLDISLHGVTAIERYIIIISPQKIQTCRSQFFHRDTPAAGVHDTHTSRDHIIFRQHSVEQHGPHSCHAVHKDHFQRLCLIVIRINRRKTRKRIFAILNTVAFVTEITAVSTVCILDDTCRCTVIAGSQRRELLRQRIHGICLVIPGIIRIAGKSSVVISQYIIHTAFRIFTIIQVQQKSISVDLHLIRCILCVQCNRFLLFIINNAHICLSCSVCCLFDIY